MAGRSPMRHAKRKESAVPMDHAVKRLIINQQRVTSELWVSPGINMLHVDGALSSMRRLTEELFARIVLFE